MRVHLGDERWSRCRARLLPLLAIPALAQCGLVEPLDPPGSGVTGTAGACSSHAACGDKLGVPARCRDSDGTCVELQTPSCPLVLGAAREPNAVFAVAYANAAVAQLATAPQTLSYALALEDLGLELSSGAMPRAREFRRPLALVICSASEGPDLSLQYQTNAEALAVIPDFSTDEVSRYFDSSNGRLFFLDPNGSSLSLANLQDDGLVWHLLGQPADFAGVYTAVLRRATAAVRARRGWDGEAKVRVAAVIGDSAPYQEMADAALAQIEAEQDDALFGPLSLQSFDLRAGNVSAVGQELAAFAPAVVVSFAGRAFSDEVVIELESAWAPADDAPRPLYVLSPDNRASLEGKLGEMVRDFQHTLPEDRTFTRFVGVAPTGPDANVYNPYVVRLRRRHPNAPAGYQRYYDAVFFLAYAIEGAEAGAGIRAADVTWGMVRLIEGSERLEVGPEDVSRVLQRLQETVVDPFSLIGTLGAPRFDAEHGTRVEAGSVYCLDEQVALHSDVLRYHPENKELRGDITRCFAGF
jgi:hypothetical protein